MPQPPPPFDCSVCVDWGTESEVFLKDSKMNCLKAVIVVIFISNPFTTSEALQCYECLYFDGHPASDPSCQQAPNSTLLKTCPTESSLSGYFNGTSHILTLISSAVKSVSDDHEMTMCVKFSGVLDEKPAIARSCIRAPSMFNGTCTTEYFQFFIDNRTVSDTVTCMCSEESCNGASGVRISYGLLFAFYAVYVLYKVIPG